MHRRWYTDIPISVSECLCIIDGTRIHHTYHCYQRVGVFACVNMILSPYCSEWLEYEYEYISLFQGIYRDITYINSSMKHEQNK